MRSRAASRGQPLIFLTLILIGWVGMRIVTWTSPISYPASLSGFATGNIFSKSVAQETNPGSSSSKPTVDGLGDRYAGELSGKARFADEEASASTSSESATRSEPIEPVVAPDLFEPAPIPPEPEIPAVPYWQGSQLQPVYRPSNRRAVPTKIAAGHQILMAAAFSQMELPPEVQAIFATAMGAQPQSGETTDQEQELASINQADDRSESDRWSVDGWLLLRPDDSASLAAIQPSYGRSQAGAVLRYNLDPASQFRPQAYARATTALEGPSETDFAAGLSARLIPKVPVRIAAEMRATQRNGDWETRPAALAITELPIMDLPFDLRAEAYAQAGYVAGDFKTAFVDGQARIDRKLANIGDSEVRIGAASWGGAQKGATRLDIGPTASVSFRLGETRAKVSADYRLRVAGDAQPNSGPAVTLTAGF